MDDLLPDAINSREESRQMKMLQMYQRLAWLILLKFKWSILVIFVIILLAGTIFRCIQFQRSPYKYEGTITLFYTPRANEDMKPLSINHVLTILSRQQIFQQLIEELHPDAKQRAALKQAIEVKMVKDQHDMFTITGRGDSDEYVKRLLSTYVAIAERNYEEYRTAELRNYLNNRNARLAELHALQEKQIERLHTIYETFGISHPQEELETLKKVQTELDASIEETKVKLTRATRAFEEVNKKILAIPAAVILHRNALSDFTMESAKRKREYEKAKLLFEERNPRYVESENNFKNILQEFDSYKEKNGITEFDPSMLVGLNDLVNAHTAAEVELNLHQSHMQSLQAEKALLKEKEKSLQKMIPQYDQVMILVKTTRNEISLLLEEVNRVRSEIDYVSNDIKDNERVLNTEKYSMFPNFVIVILLAGAVLCSAIYAGIVVMYEIYYGRFSGIAEAATLRDFVDTVGMFPSHDLPISLEERHIIEHNTFYNFILHLKATRVVFCCCLDGSFVSSFMFNEQFVQAKRNTILVRIITEQEAEIRCSDMQKIGDFYYSDNGRQGTNFVDAEIKNDIEYLGGFASEIGRGYGYGYGYAFFPVRKLGILEPDEITRLYNTIKELKKHYQLVRIAREKPFEVAEAIVRQLNDICEGMLLYIGKDKTKRRVLRQVMNLRNNDNKIYAIITNATQVEKVLAGDYM